MQLRTGILFCAMDEMLIVKMINRMLVVLAERADEHIGGRIRLYCNTAVCLLLLHTRLYLRTGIAVNLWYSYRYLCLSSRFYKGIIVIPVIERCTLLDIPLRKRLWERKIGAAAVKIIHRDRWRFINAVAVQGRMVTAQAPCLVIGLQILRCFSMQLVYLMKIAVKFAP